MHTQGTVYIKQTDRRGLITYDAVVCASCAAKMRAYDGLPGDRWHESPWIGDVRPCSECDDSENAPEFKFDRPIP